MIVQSADLRGAWGRCEGPRSRTEGKFVAQTWSLGSTTLGEALPLVEPQFPHLEMGIEALNLSGLPGDNGRKAE